MCIHLSDQQIKYNVFQREMMAATEKLHPLIGNCKGGSSWRDGTGLFPSGTEGPRGLLNLSPAWFQQGHEVSCFSLSNCHRQLDRQLIFNLDGATIPSGWLDFQKASCLGMARCHLSI
jgi:hypothetical protein